MAKRPPGRPPAKVQCPICKRYYNPKYSHVCPSDPPPSQ